jgi:hypothetical protein
MDKAKGLLVKIRVDSELWASKKTNLYFDRGLSQKAVVINKNEKIGTVVEVDDKYIEIYYVEDEDNQQTLYLSPKSKTYTMGKDGFGIDSRGRAIFPADYDFTNPKEKKTKNVDETVEKLGNSTQWFSNILAVIGEGINAYTKVKESSYDDYVNSETTYPNYTYPKTEINDSNKSEVNNTASQASKNTVLYLVGFLFLLLVLVVIFKVSNRSKMDAQGQNFPSQRVIYLR